MDMLALSKINRLKEEMAGLALGSVPDRSIESIKLSLEIADTLTRADSLLDSGTQGGIDSLVNDYSAYTMGLNMAVGDTRFVGIPLTLGSIIKDVKLKCTTAGPVTIKIATKNTNGTFNFVKNFAATLTVGSNVVTIGEMVLTDNSYVGVYQPVGGAVVSFESTTGQPSVYKFTGELTGANVTPVAVTATTVIALQITLTSTSSLVRNVTDLDGILAVHNKADIIDSLNTVSNNGVAKQSIKKSNATITKMYTGVATKIIAFGDSVTWGYRPTLGTQSASPYPTVLQSKLRTIYGNNNITVVNAGNPGYTATGLLGVVSAQVLTQAPDLVILMCGINDANPVNSVTRDTYKASMTTLIKQILATGSELILMSATPIWQSTSDRLHSLQSYTRIIEDLVAHYELGFIDLNKELEKMFLYKRDTPYIAYGGANIDYVHLADSTYGCVAEIVVGKALTLHGVHNVVPVISSETHIIAVNNNCITTDCTSASVNSSQYSSQNYSLASDSSTGSYLRFAFFADRDGMDLFLVGAKTKAGGQLSILDNGVAIKTVDGFSNHITNTARYDAEDLILENVKYGLHIIEILVANLIVGQSTTGIGKIYVSEFVFKPTVKTPVDILYKIFGTVVPVMEKFHKVCNTNGVLRMDGTGVTWGGAMLQDDKTAGLKSGKTLVIEAEGMFPLDGGISYFGAKGEAAYALSAFGYLIRLNATAINAYIFEDTNVGTALATYAISPNFSIPHKLRVTHTYEGLITVFLDGVQVMQFTNTKEKSGKFGLYVGGNGGILELSRLEYCYR